MIKTFEKDYSSPVNEWLLLQEGFVLYLTIFLALLGGAIGLPIPEDLPVFAAGVALQRGNVELQLIFIVCYGAILLGDILIFFIGRWFGPHLFEKKWFKKKVSPKRIKAVKLSLEKRSLLMIFIARHLFYLRTATFLTCGAVKMKPRRFIAADAIAALISVPLMLYLGYVASENYDAVMGALKRAEIIGGVIALLAISIFMIIRKRKRNRAKVETETP